MKETQIAKRNRKLSFAFILIILLLLSGFYVWEVYKNQQLKEGLGDFMGYMVNVTIYCAELNNMTYEDLLKSYLELETDKIIEEVFPE